KLLLHELREATVRLAAAAPEVTEVEVVVLEAEQRKRVVDGDRTQLRVDLVAFDLGIIELVQHLAALVRLFYISLIQLVVVLHRLLRDAVQLFVECGKVADLYLVPGHDGSFLWAWISSLLTLTRGSACETGCRSFWAGVFACDVLGYPSG